MRGIPFPALHHAAGPVAAVLTLHCQALGAFERRREGVCAAGEEEEHFGGGAGVWRSTLLLWTVS